MNVAELQRLRQLSGGDERRLPTPRSRESVDGGFADTLAQAIQEVDRAQKDADEQVEAFIAGEQENLHEVMISMNQARLYFQLMTEVRNRLLETYQELMRTQI
ncbi:flagellar hook-basal body complex protein FliE [Rhodothermus marinus]|uniref:Flagellar hook-basal body complex protein FliE n=1 Tax=Rhodothermus marinus (strain ATCC 43812 / DSM 4252 / R-10) TaxID=518766 RepID=D0MGD3_RHOM4|nr:flagellar hook-basal body complex protein FliE [Rhodothermus marinus]ACY47689.1 flagellar hook-basal body complex subunit FliE [Rhodothermus marinus DSM 4252]BBM68975.1 flagellar hook-basal body complex protein FliE [Rhodothermus marinus]BBM71953.1 flagellar hook-basal body complex protein FliE [Rhodothermus marinus]